MATCKDCINYEKCGGSLTNDFIPCDLFKNKANFVELPCKVGDTIYQTDGVRVYESTINEITITPSKTIYVTENIVFDERAIHKSIFLTKEEATQALKARANK